MAEVAAVHAALGGRVIAAGQQPLVADEGGWAPRLRSNREAVDWVAEAIAAAGVEAAIALDIAATELLDPTTGEYVLTADDQRLTSSQLVDDFVALVEARPVVSIEDALAEDDWDGWSDLTRRLGTIQLIGDDLFVTNAARLQRGIEAGVANAILVKPNQAGTLTEALDVIRLARASGYRTIVSARSGETEDAFLADLAVGSAAGQIKVGSITRSERLAKWNQLLRIEAELGSGSYVGASALART
jgi:enolase